MHYFIRTFGCQMNEHDTARMASKLIGMGHKGAASPEDADIVIFNTCTVRAKPHDKAISEVGKVLKRRRAGANVIVAIAGCVAQEEQGNLFNTFPDLDIVLGPDQISRLPELIENIVNKRSEGTTTSINATTLINNYADYNFVQLENPDLIKESNRRSEYVTIIKGCNNFCSFCIVPYVRGREVSKLPEEIITEIRRMTGAGVKEITLLGQNVNSYGGREPGYPAFPELLRLISNETDVMRIRYMSPHPKDLCDDLIEEHRVNSKLCSSLHLPLQAGSSDVLKRMNRKYTKEDYLARVAELKSAVPEIAISTDIIVGFPGETDEDFQETLNVMSEVEYDGMFAFKYSPRPGTRSGNEFTDDVPAETKRERLTKVLELNGKIVLQKHEKYVGTRQEVLVEGPSQRGEGQLTGRTGTNKIVNLSGSEDMAGKVVTVLIDWAGINSMRGKVV